MIDINYLKKMIYILTIVIGLLAIIGGVFPHYIETYLLPERFIIVNINWLIIIGLIFVSGGSVLLAHKKIIKYEIPYIKYSIIEIIIISSLIFSLAYTCGWVNGQHDQTMTISTENIEKTKQQLAMLESMDKENPFYSKKVIIRDDDIGNFSYIESVRWLSELCIEKDIKATYALVPAELVYNPGTISYLNTLDRAHFEFAVHGNEHIKFKDLPYHEQYYQIETATKIIEDKLNFKPVTFVPPFGSGDVNTTKACRLLGYHSITDVFGYPSYIMDFASDFEWEERYDFISVSHHKFEDFRDNFDEFCNSSNEYYIIYLHDWTFIDKENKLDREKTGEFEKAIDYMKTNDVQFFTIEEAYRWRIDEPNIRTFKIDEYNYAIDMMECRYNHTLKFCSPLDLNEPIKVTDMNTDSNTSFNKRVFEFYGIKGHWYIISIKNS